MEARTIETKNQFMEHGELQ